jgi:hypothetical protein
MTSIPHLLAELMVGVGVALSGTNLWVLIRPRVQPSTNDKPIPEPPSIPWVVVKIVIGALLAAAGVVAILQQR